MNITKYLNEFFEMNKDKNYNDKMKNILIGFDSIFLEYFEDSIDDEIKKRKKVELAVKLYLKIFTDEIDNINAINTLTHDIDYQHRAIGYDDIINILIPTRNYFDYLKIDGELKEKISITPFINAVNLKEKLTSCLFWLNDQDFDSKAKEHSYIYPFGISILGGDGNHSTYTYKLMGDKGYFSIYQIIDARKALDDYYFNGSSFVKIDFNGEKKLKKHFFNFNNKSVSLRTVSFNSNMGRIIPNDIVVLCGYLFELGRIMYFYSKQPEFDNLELYPKEIKI